MVVSALFSHIIIQGSTLHLAYLFAIYFMEINRGFRSADDKFRLSAGS